MTYWHDHHAKHRKGVALIIEGAVCRDVKAADYAAALTRYSAEDYMAEIGTSHPPKLFGTCLDCFGAGDVRNPHWSDDGGSEPETTDCETCLGVGMVEIIDPPPVPEPGTPIDDDMPF